jgi:deoxycytidine triphosphate deaminase
MAPEDYQEYAATDAEAEARFQRTFNSDPFPKIAPSLLNSADICDYVRMTGMLHPFRPDKVKSASYEAAVGGRCIWWDEHGVWQEVDLEKEDREFTLRANSIAFVQVEPKFRLPDYMALRFNLKITHVHRGILLGTGPLVDPGFVGRLLIPLHNLTTNPYTLKRGDGLIWIEFTKTSPLPKDKEPDSDDPRRRGRYVRFPEDKKNLDAEVYFRKATGNQPIRSSLPQIILESRDATERAREAATNAEAQVKQITDRYRRYSVFGLVGLAVALAAVTISILALIHNVWTSVHNTEVQLRQELEKVAEKERRLNEVERGLGALSRDLKAVEQRSGISRSQSGRR